jgi:radical SAM superfamily enzyme YgiQ (UPF0313 family)
LPAKKFPEHCFLLPIEKLLLPSPARDRPYPMDVTEITAKTALVKSKIPGVDYVINPYLGCGHGCRYCYATFMRRYARHHAGAPGTTWEIQRVNQWQLRTVTTA